MMLSQNIISELKQLLLADRDKLVSELKEIAKPNPSIPGDWTANFPKFEEHETGSSGSTETEQDEVEEYEVLLEAEHTLESRLLEVTEALERIEKGNYGICRVCKKDISLERLKANPAAKFDKEHAL